MSPNDIVHFCTVFAERNECGGYNYKMSQKSATNLRGGRCCVSAKGQTGSYRTIALQCINSLDLNTFQSLYDRDMFRRYLSISLYHRSSHREEVVVNFISEGHASMSDASKIIQRIKCSSYSCMISLINHPWKKSFNRGQTEVNVRALIASSWQGHAGRSLIWNQNSDTMQKDSIIDASSASTACRA